MTSTGLTLVEDWSSVQIEKEDIMKGDEAEEVSRRMRIGQNLLPKQMNNLGINRRKRVKISSKEQSA